MVKSVVAGCTFFEAIRGYNTAISIYTDCDDMMPVGRYESKERALSWVGKPYPYHLFDSNYHRFTARCITGKSCDDIYLASHLDRFRLGKH